MSASKTLTFIWDYFMLTFASLVFALAWECFMIPNNMSAGGMMGLCTVIQYATGGFLQASYSYIALNAILIIIAVAAMGIGFGFKTIYAIVMTTVAMRIVAPLEVIHCLPGCLFYVRETIMIPIVAGCLEAVGIGLILRFGGSTGGTDIIALMINKYWPINLSSVFFVTDFLVVMLILLLPGKTFADMIYGFVEIVAFTLMIDWVVGGRKSYQLLVFSRRHAEIADYICNELERGVTVLNGTGWYTGKTREILLIILDKKEFLPLSRKIKEMDPDAFMSVAPTHNVYGEGFSEIKIGPKIDLKKITSKIGRQDEES